MNFRWTLCLPVFGLVLLGSAAYFESKDAAKKNYDAQVKEIETWLDAQLDRSAETRKEFWHRDYSSPTAYDKAVGPYRRILAEMIGGSAADLQAKPLTAEQLSARREQVAEADNLQIYRVWLTARNRLHAYGILLVPNGASRLPGVVCIHGMGSGPEYVTGLIEQQDYVRNFGRRLAQRGYVVFAPLMANTIQARSDLDRKAIMLGTRLQWIEQQKISSVVDYLATLPEVDPKKIGAYGISWGGRTVMYQGALDERIAATVISGHFNDTVPKMVTPSPHYKAFIETPEDYSFFSKLATRFSDADVTSMICPRPVFIEEGRKDPVVWYPMAQKAFAELKTHYDKLGLGDRAEMELFDDEHVVHGDDAFVFLDKRLKGLF